MSLHYNAFISYKHAELDNKVAADIEKLLERYHIPKKIQKKTGMKKIERIFRDKDELPITSDLTDTINEALLNSDYLIVLCSKSTRLSTWVEREISLFLQTHPLDHVLTVLAEGEPYEVIPQMLLSRTVQRLNYMGQVETVIEPVEPLSCDFRLPRKEAINTELPRLAAALIGCSYNELMNRQRQYKMKRLTAMAAGVMALSVGFGGYMLYSNQRINENYQNSLINQSRYLANSSEQLLEDEKRIDALHLALAALPNEETPDRPVIPEAERAIANASLAYETVYGSNITSVWNYTMPDNIDKFYVGPDGDSLAAIDMSDNVMVWDAQTKELVYSYSSSDDCADVIYYISEDKLLVTGLYFVRCVDVKNKTVLWEHEKLGDGAVANYYAASANGSFVYVPVSDETIYKLDSATGNIVDTYGFTENDIDAINCYFTDMIISPDEQKLMFEVELGDTKDKSLCIYNLSDKTYEFINLKEMGLFIDDNFLSNFCWIDNDTVAIAVNQEGMDGNYGFLNMDVYSTNHDIITCINLEDKSTRWSYDFSFSTYSSKDGFIVLTEMDGLCFYKGNKATIIDPNTGEMLYDYNLNDVIVGAKLNKGAELPIFQTESGKHAMPLPSQGTDTIALTKYFTDDIDSIKVSKGAYAHVRNSNSIIYYGVGVSDDEYLSFDATLSYDNIMPQSAIVGENSLAVLRGDDAGITIDLYDAQNKKFLKSVHIDNEDNSYNHYNFIAADKGKIYISHYSSIGGNVLELIELDDISGNNKTTTLAEATSCGEMSYKDGKIAYFDSKSYSQNTIALYDVETAEKKEFALPEDGYVNVENVEYCPEDGIIYLAGSSDYILNVGSGEMVSVTHSSDWQDTKKVSIDAISHKTIETDFSSIEVSDYTGEKLYSIKCPEIKPYDVSVYRALDNSKAVLLVPYEDGLLYRYDLETGELIGKTEFTPYTSPITTNRVEFNYDLENNLLYLQLDGVIDIIELKSYVQTACVVGSLGYHEGTDTFIVTSDVENSQEEIGYFRHYSVQELIEKARKLTKGTEPSQELREEYGF